MQPKTKISFDSLKCAACKKQTRHMLTIGPRQPDPQHADDRSFDFHAVTLRCTRCGRTEQRKRLPYLLAHFFSM